MSVGGNPTQSSIEEMMQERGIFLDRATVHRWAIKIMPILAVVFRFKSFRCARILLAGIEVMHMIRKGQLDCPGAQPVSAAQQFYSLAF